MAKRKSRYKTRRGYVSAVKRGLKSGKYKTVCKKFTRSFCFTTRGKPVSCKGAIGRQYRKPIRRSFYRCIDAVTKRFASKHFCSCKRGKRR